jgi:hypothetical protein
VSIIERIRRFWGPSSEPDHPLTEDERKGVPPTAVDEAASQAERFVGDAFDPDAPDRH